MLVVLEADGVTIVVISILFSKEESSITVRAFFYYGHGGKKTGLRGELPCRPAGYQTTMVNGAEQAKRIIRPIRILFTRRPQRPIQGVLVPHQCPSVVKMDGSDP
jgi:hypothetical protein